MPLLQADSSGGVIITDWYANPQNPGERMKVTVSILDQDLRADALRVAASRQVSQGGAWVDAPVQAATVQKLEEVRSEEHTSELQSLMRISYAVFCLKKKKKQQ